MTQSVGMVRNCGRFLMGDWAHSVGRMCYEARKAPNNPASLCSFGWSNAYSDYWAGVDSVKRVQDKVQPKLKSSIDAAVSRLGRNASVEAKNKAIEKAGQTFLKKATQKASKADKKAIAEVVKKTVKSETNTGFFSKIGKFFGKIPGVKFVAKKIFPILIGVQTVSSAIAGYKEGGLAGALKETARGLLKLGGLAVATAGAAAFGAGPILGMVVGGLFSGFVLDKGIDKVLGQSPEEKQELAQLEEQQNAEAGVSPDIQPVNPFAAAVAKNSGRSLASFGANAKLSQAEFNKTLDAIMQPAINAMDNRNDIYGI